MRAHWLLLLLVACDSNPELPEAKQPTNPTGATPSPTGAFTPTAGATGGGSGLVKQSSIKWTAPQGWEAVPSSSQMRLATYRIPKAEGDAEDGELTVIQARGDLQSNVARWAGQFEGGSQPKTSERTVGALKVTIVEIEGAYKGMSMPGQPPAQKKEGYAMLAAMVESSKGTDPHFFKLTGPKKTVEAARGGFEELISSVGEP